MGEIYPAGIKMEERQMGSKKMAYIAKKEPAIYKRVGSLMISNCIEWSIPEYYWQEPVRK